MSAKTYIAATLLALGCINSSIAQVAYPERPIRLIVPFAPGGATEIISRAIGHKMSVSLNQTIVVDARGGAGGVLGTDIAAKATPDGYTLLMATAANAANESLVKNMPHNFARDFKAICLVVMSPYMLVMHPSIPVNSVKDVIEYAKSRPGQLNYASAGTGSSQHLSGELFQLMSGAKFTHIPYKGTGAALVDLVTGRVQLMFSAIPPVLPLVKDGKLKAFAVTSSKRSMGLPNLPTIAESGVPGYGMSGWFGFMAPSRTSNHVVNKINKAARAAIDDSELQKFFVSRGLEPIGNTPAEFTQFIADELKKYANIVAKTGVHK